MRDLDSVLTDRNLRTVGLIERKQSIRLEGVLRAAPTKRVKRKAPGVVIAGEGDEEHTPTNDEPVAGPSDSFQGSKGRRKGKAVAHKCHKSSRWKSITMSLPASGVRISEAPPFLVENPFEGLADILIPDFVSLQHDTGLEEFQCALDLSESLPTSVADITGWSGGCTHIHSTTLHGFQP